MNRFDVLALRRIALCQYGFYYTGESPRRDDDTHGSKGSAINEGCGIRMDRIRVKSTWPRLAWGTTSMCCQDAESNRNANSWRQHAERRMCRELTLGSFQNQASSRCQRNHFAETVPLVWWKACGFEMRHHRSIRGRAGNDKQKTREGNLFQVPRRIRYSEPPGTRAPFVPPERGSATEGRWSHTALQHKGSQPLQRLL